MADFRNSRRGNILDQAIILACSTQPQVIPEIKRYVGQLGLPSEYVWKRTPSLATKGKLHEAGRIVYLKKDIPERKIRVLADLVGYRSTSRKN